MFKEVLNHADLAHWAEAGLVIFFAVFILVTLWAMTRSRRTLQDWALIPLEDGSPREMQHE
jgi:hypothetical protein